MNLFRKVIKKLFRKKPESYKSNRITGYSLTKAWFQYVFSCNIKIRPVHSALYFWIIEKNNRLGWATEFQLPTDEACEACGVSDKETILKAIKDLCEWGFIKISQKAINRFTARYIRLLQPKFSNAANSEKPNATPDATPTLHPTLQSQNEPPVEDSDHTKLLNYKTSKTKEREGPERENLKNKEHLFDHSPYYNNFEKFKDDIGEDYQQYNLGFYHRQMKDYSAANNLMKADWMAYCRMWISRDINEGKVRKKVKISGPPASKFLENEQFSRVWNKWRKYLRDIHKMDYPDKKSERNELINLEQLSFGDINQAIEIIEKAIIEHKTKFKDVILRK